MQEVGREGPAVLLQVVDAGHGGLDMRVHAAFLGLPPPLAQVARGTGRHDVLPGRATTQSSRRHMIKGQLIGVAAVLALELIASDIARDMRLTLLAIGGGNPTPHESQEIVRRNIGGCVNFISDVSTQELNLLYNAAFCLIYPSIYEGFGIPILEAMAANRPIVLSDLSVFREITEDQGIYFPHDDVESMAFAIEKVLFSSSEAARLVEYGKKRVEAFSFKSLAAQLESLYTSLS